MLESKRLRERTTKRLKGTWTRIRPPAGCVAISGPLIPRLRRSIAAGAMLDGVNVASLALLAGVMWDLGHAAFVDPLTIVLGIVSAFALFRLGVKPGWIAVGGALIGHTTR